MLSLKLEQRYEELIDAIVKYFEDEVLGTKNNEKKSTTTKRDR